MGLDSLAFVEIQLAMQQEYGFTIPDEDAEQIATIGEAIEYTNRRPAASRKAESDGRATDNSVVIDAPLDVVWERMNDVESWPSLFSEYAKCGDPRARGQHRAVPADDASRSRVRRTGLELGLGADGRSGQTHTVKARRIETGPFEYMNIEWYFEPAGGGTRCVGAGLLDEADRPGERRAGRGVHEQEHDSEQMA